MGKRKYALIILFSAVLFSLIPDHSFAAGMPLISGAKQTGSFTTGQEQSEGEKISLEQAEILDTDGLWDDIPDSAKEYVDGLDTDSPDYSAISDKLDPSNLFASLIGEVKGELAKPLKTLGMLMGIILLCAVMRAFTDGSAGGQFHSVVAGVSMIACVACVFGSLKDSITYLIQTVQDIVLFMQSFVPIMAGAVAASGSPTSAGAFSGVLFILCEVVSSIAGYFFLPIVCIHLALTVAGGVNPDLEKTGITKTIKNFVTWGLGLVSTVFVGIMSLRTGITALPDSVMKKTFKFAAGKFVPIVGSTLGEATDMVLTSAATLKAGIGTIGVVIIFFSFFGPIIHALVWVGCIKCAQIAAGIAGESGLSKFFEGITAAFSMIVALLFFSGLAFLVCVSVMIRTGGV